MVTIKSNSILDVGFEQGTSGTAVQCAKLPFTETTDIVVQSNTTEQYTTYQRNAYKKYQ